MLQTETPSAAAEKLAEHADKVATNVESVTTAATQSTVETVKQSIDMIQQLQQKGIIQCLQIDERKTGRTISDVKYTIKAAPQFISEQIASNKRATDTKTIAQKSNIRIIKKA